MITDTRKMFKSRWFRIAIIVFVITMAGGGLLLQLVTHFQGNKDWALRVNGQDISRTRLARAVAFQQERINQIRRMYGQYADLMLEQQGLSKDPTKPAVEQLIFTNLLNQEANKIGVVVDSDHILDKLADPNYVAGNLSSTIPMEIFNPQGGIAGPALRNYLRRMHMSHAEFEKNLENAFARTTLLHMVMPASYVPHFMLRDAYQQAYAPRNFSFVNLDYNTILDQVKQEGVQEDELRAFFEKNKAAYQIPEKRTGMSWQFDAASYDATISNEALQSYYEKHKKEFVKERPKIQVRRILFKVEDESAKDQIMAQVEALRSELIKNPETFEAVAKEQSQDEVSAAEGGLLSFFARGERVASDGVPFERAAFTLQKDGDISAVVESKNGFDLVQRVGRKPRIFKEFNDVKSEIRTILTQKEIEKRFVSDVQTMLTDKKINEAAWKAFVKRHSPKMKAITDIEKDANNELFKLKEGESSAYLKGQIGEVITLNSIKEAYTPELSNIKSTVESDFYAQKAENRLKELYNKVSETIKSGGIEAAANQLDQPIETTEAITPGSEQEKELKDKGIPVRGFFQLTAPGATMVDLTGKNLVVAELKSIENVDEQLFQEKQDELMRKVSGELVGLFISGYIASLHKNAKIETNDSIVNIP